jgi:hypothetical protein
MLARLASTLLLFGATGESSPRGGNERVVIVADGASGLSLALARRYAELRAIPAEQILVLDSVPGGGPASADPISLAECRDGILAPILAALEQRGLADEIDAILFSSGFPHAVDVAAAAHDRRLDQSISGVAALTGLTFFAREVVKNDLSCLDLMANGYADLPEPRRMTRAEADPDLKMRPSRGFAGDPEGRGRHYLSAFLAWLGPYGTSFEAAVAGLERSSAADGADPRGTFYFLVNGDVRAKTREPLFAAAMRELEARGRRTQLLEPGPGENGEQDGVLPKGRKDVLGAMIGAADFDWSASGSTILPGAIVEHLTSFGASFQIGGQTKLTALLRAGAAGASGTVTEPYAIQAKFPTPYVHVHYADGCSLAESFFQSVAGPYQLLVVGDACCRPFAKFPEIELPASAITIASSSAPGVPPAIGAAPSNGAWRGTVALAPVVRGEVARLEAWVDGRLVAAVSAGAPLPLDTTALDDGAHVLHVAAAGPPPLGIAASIARRIVVANREGVGAATTLSGPSKSVELGQLVKLQGRAPAGSRVEILEGARRLASLDASAASGGAWKLELQSGALGPGKVELQARALLQGGGAARSDFLALALAPPDVATSAEAPGDLLPGLAVDVVVDRKPRRLGVLGFADPLPLPPNSRATVRGWVKLPAAGLHEWSASRAALVGLALDGRKLVVEPAGAGAPLARGGSLVATIAAGWHTFEATIESFAGDAPRLSLLGPDGPVALGEGTAGQGPATLRRVPKEKLQPKVAAWCDGDRGAAAAPKEGDAAEVDFAGGSTRLGAVVLRLALDADEAAAAALRDRLVLESRDGASWSNATSEEPRLLRTRSNPPSVVLVWTIPNRRARRIRLRDTDRSAKDGAVNGAGALASIAEIEVFESTGAK